MRFNSVNTLIAFLISFLLSYGLTTWIDSKFFYTVFLISGLCQSAGLIAAIGINYQDGRVGLSIRTASILYYICSLVLLAVLNLLSVGESTFVIINGVLLLLFVLIVNGINNSAQA